MPGRGIGLGTGLRGLAVDTSISVDELFDFTSFVNGEAAGYWNSGLYYSGTYYQAGIQTDKDVIVDEWDGVALDINVVRVSNQKDTHNTGGIIVNPVNDDLIWFGCDHNGPVNMQVYKSTTLSSADLALIDTVGPTDATYGYAALTPGDEGQFSLITRSATAKLANYHFIQVADYESPTPELDNHFSTGQYLQCFQSMDGSKMYVVTYPGPFTHQPVNLSTTMGEARVWNHDITFFEIDLATREISNANGVIAADANLVTQPFNPASRNHVAASDNPSNGSYWSSGKMNLNWFGRVNRFGTNDETVAVLRATGNNGTHYITNTASTATSGKTYICSQYVARDVVTTLQQVRITGPSGSVNSGAAQPYAEIDFETETLLSSGFITGTTKDEDWGVIDVPADEGYTDAHGAGGENWKRVWFRFTADTTVSGVLGSSCFLMQAGTITFNNNGAGILWGGAQQEEALPGQIGPGPHCQNRSALEILPVEPVVVYRDDNRYRRVVCLDAKEIDPGVMQFAMIVRSVDSPTTNDEQDDSDIQLVTVSTVTGGVISNVHVDTWGQQTIGDVAIVAKDVVVYTRHNWHNLGTNYLNIWNNGKIQTIETSVGADERYNGVIAFQEVTDEGGFKTVVRPEFSVKKGRNNDGLDFLGTECKAYRVNGTGFVF